MVNLENLFKRISEQGLTAKKLSNATGISTGNISDWKSGRSMPSAVKLDILADYLDCSVDYLLGRTDVPEVNRRGVNATSRVSESPTAPAETQAQKSRQTTDIS